MLYLIIILAHIPFSEQDSIDPLWISCANNLACLGDRNERTDNLKVHESEPQVRISKVKPKMNNNFSYYILFCLIISYLPRVLYLSRICIYSSFDCRNVGNHVIDNARNRRKAQGGLTALLISCTLALLSTFLIKLYVKSNGIMDELKYF